MKGFVFSVSFKMRIYYICYIYTQVEHVVTRIFNFLLYFKY